MVRWLTAGESHGPALVAIVEGLPAGIEVSTADLDRDLPSPLGIVTVHSNKPADLGLNHQVLAYGYSAQGPVTSVNVYDPNSGQDDGIAISFDTRTPTKATTFTHNIDISHTIRGFFRTAYSPASPPS